jgi:hypothetical protein
MSPVRYELGFYIPGGDILQSHCREHLKSYTSAETSVSLVCHGMCSVQSSEKRLCRARPSPTWRVASCGRDWPVPDTGVCSDPRHG